MRVIDVDTDLLRRRADAAVHSGNETQRHLQAEFTDEIELVMTTLAREEPYAYTYRADVQPDGTIRQPIARTRDEVRGAYESLHGTTAVTSMTPFTEIRGDWYTFNHC